MDDSPESTQEDGDTDLLGSSSESINLKKIKPPNKKKHEEEVELITTSIKTKENVLKSLSQENDLIGSELKSARSEKLACIEKLKKIDTDLKTLNQEITSKKNSLDRLQSTLHYKSEGKIDDAIKRLEWQLKVQNFKLIEEKKIVAEIDSLKRSKKSLSQYLTLKTENDDMRDRQRRMRQERDHYQKSVNNLRHREEDLKKKVHENKTKLDTLKKEIGKLIESKRKLHQNFKQQEKDFQEQKVEKKQQKRIESFKRKEDRRITMEAFQKDILENYEPQRVPYQDEINLCNTLTHYLQKFPVNSEFDSPAGTPEDVSMSRVPGMSGLNYAKELEDGKYVLLKKEEDTEYQGLGRKTSKRRPSKKGRKQSVKFYEEGGQLMFHRVCTPSIEEHHASDAGISSSDAGVSLTESAMCEMSRQASNTESTGNPAETSYLVLDELVRLSNEEVTSETMSEVSEDTLGRSNSDSTEHGDNSDQSVNSLVEKKVESLDVTSDDTFENSDNKIDNPSETENSECKGDNYDDSNNGFKRM
ncbi:hypothetical protein KUTeg_000128 [Tegillarca granosa]|uniref:Uncharacterized protein n=1 Tax=Tegillarca granosa TaxID=220873 RepID=A0ABQ9G037_TEGGR|nr:hypothetical protein KUTeg_000128 [Tegillarca granosa]